MKISEEEKAMWLEDWRRSGKKAWTYARENGLVPFKYLKAVYEKAPYASTLEDWARLLPWNIFKS